jgi:hypothetical protein
MPNKNLNDCFVWLLCSTLILRVSRKYSTNYIYIFTSWNSLAGATPREECDCFVVLARDAPNHTDLGFHDADPVRCR